MTLLDDIQVFPELNTILMMDSSGDFRMDYDIEAMRFGSYKIAPWGSDNLLPNHVLKKVSDNDIVAANLKFNRDVCFGLGPKLIRVLSRDKGVIRDYEEVTEGPEYEFFERNDIPMYLLSQLTDMNHFYNTFSELIPSKSEKKIESIRHKEAVFSRFSMMNSRGEIKYHYYADWADNPTEKDIIATKVIDEFNAIRDLEMHNAKKNNLIYSAYMPSPGKPYYSRPEWYSIFSSGWYDHSCMVPQLKKAILKNQLGVKYIIYISPQYFEDICKREGIDINDRQAYSSRVEKEKKAFSDFLSGEKNANKTILALKNMMPTVNGVAESKYIEITPIANDLKGGEYIDDTESTANIICYAMGVHSALIGATPGKNSNTLGGSNARELYLIKQAMMKPVVDRVLRPLKIIKDYNKWDKDILITVPEYIFTTLDQNKSGKQESTNNNV